MGAQSADEVDSFVANSFVTVEETTWEAFEQEFEDKISTLDPSHHFYYVKPADGHVLWPEMAMYDEEHSTFVGAGTPQAVRDLRRSAKI